MNHVRKRPRFAPGELDSSIARTARHSTHAVEPDVVVVVAVLDIRKAKKKTTRRPRQSPRAFLTEAFPLLTCREYGRGRGWIPRVLAQTAHAPSDGHHHRPPSFPLPAAYVLRAPHHSQHSPPGGYSEISKKVKMAPGRVGINTTLAFNARHDGARDAPAPRTTTRTRRDIGPCAPSVGGGVLRCRRMGFRGLRQGSTCK